MLLCSSRHSRFRLRLLRSNSISIFLPVYPSASIQRSTRLHLDLQRRPSSSCLEGFSRSRSRACTWSFALEVSSPRGAHSLRSRGDQEECTLRFSLQEVLVSHLLLYRQSQNGFFKIQTQKLTSTAPPSYCRRSIVGVSSAWFLYDFIVSPPSSDIAIEDARALREHEFSES